MKKLILLIVFIPLFSLGQSIDVLEDKNGYKIFKLNSDKSNYVNNLKLINKNDGFSTYNYQETVEYEIVNESIYFKKKTSLNNLANRYSTTLINIRNLNPNMKDRKGYIKKQKNSSSRKKNISNKLY